MGRQQSAEKQFVIIGGGPAGLTAAYELVKFNHHPIVLEERDKVGGLARTECYKGFHFDMGGHRFFTKSNEVKRMWREVLGTDFLRRPRLSRIFYNRKFFYYPLKPLNALVGLGVWKSIRIVVSYFRWQVFPYEQEDTFEQWVTNRFGRRLFQTFFKTYTEKVWGIPCSELKAEWAAQRIKNLSLRTALVSMFVKPQKTIKSLIDEFDYPRLGPGMMWKRVQEKIDGNNGDVQLNSKVTQINRIGQRIDSVVISRNGNKEKIQGTHFISSMPLTDFVRRLNPAPPSEVLSAAEKLQYRDFLTVCLIVNKPQLFSDNWIYIHDPDIKVGRIQNYKNWSPEMVPDPKKTSLGLEYFCNEGDELWNTPDAGLIELGKREVDRIGLVSYSDIEDGCVVRVPKAYPVYNSDYRDHLRVVREFVEDLQNFQTVGRNGLHRYNNQDHAMLTGMLAVRNLLFGERNDLWSVNPDEEYLEEIHEEESAVGLTETVEGILSRVFFKLDRMAFGLALGVVASLLLSLVTLVLVLKGGDAMGLTLGSFSQYFPGYSITKGGTLFGLLYGFVAGFVGGWSFALLRNVTMFLIMALTYRHTERHLMRDLFKHI